MEERKNIKFYFLRFRRQRLRVRALSVSCVNAMIRAPSLNRALLSRRSYNLREELRTNDFAVLGTAKQYTRVKGENRQSS